MQRGIFIVSNKNSGYQTIKVRESFHFNENLYEELFFHLNEDLLVNALIFLKYNQFFHLCDNKNQVIF